MTPQLVQSDLAALLANDEIDDTIKRGIVGESAAYAEAAEKQGLNELARLAVHYKTPIPVDVIQHMTREGVSAEYVVPLLQPHLDTLASTDLFAILKAMSGDYSKLAVVGRSVLHIPNTSADRALLEHLKRHGTVSSFDATVSPIKVNRKRK